MEGLIPSCMRHLRTSNKLLSWPPKAEEPPGDAEAAPKAKAKLKAKQEKQRLLHQAATGGEV